MSTIPLSCSDSSEPEKFLWNLYASRAKAPPKSASLVEEAAELDRNANRWESKIQSFYHQIAVDS